MIALTGFGIFKLVLILFAIAVALVNLAPAATGQGMRDALLKITKTLPAAAGTVTPTAGIDTGAKTGLAYQEDDVEYLLSAPALNTTQLPDTKVLTYNIITSASSDLSTPTTLFAAPIVQTGAGAAGALAATFKFKLPSNAQQFVGFNAVGGAAIGDCSAASGKLEALV